MRKIYTLLLAMAVGLSAAAQKEITIPKIPAETEINLDGADDEAFWGQLDQHDVDLELPDDYGDANYFEAWFKMAYNDTALFMLFFRNEDEFSSQWDTELADWQSDRDEIFFDVHTANLEDGVGASDSQEAPDATATDGATLGHYQFTSRWAVSDTVEDDPGMLNEFYGIDEAQWYHNTPYYVAWELTGDIYMIEYAFPFENLTVDTDLLPDADPYLSNEEGTTFGMEVSMNDVDNGDNPTDESFRKLVRWGNDAEDYDPWGGETGMDPAGRVTLGAELEVTSVSNIVENNMAVYPNPANNYITVENAGIVNVEIYDISGRAVKSVNNVSPNNQINVSDLNTGLYIIEITDADNNLSIGKFKKQ